jgi:hypothetical protein
VTQENVRIPIWSNAFIPQTLNPVLGEVFYDTCPDKTVAATLSFVVEQVSTILNEAECSIASDMNRQKQ